MIQHNLKPIYNFPIANVDDRTAYAWEAAHIQYYGLSNLTNIVPGGIVYNPMAGKHHKKESKEKVKMHHNTTEYITTSFLRAVKQYGGFGRYLEKLYRKQERKQKEQLRRDLRSLNSTINYIKKQLIKNEKRKQIHRAKTLKYAGCLYDYHNSRFSRLCPVCGDRVTHTLIRVCRRLHRRNARCVKCVSLGKYNKESLI